jgi:hypothetical protein
MASPFTAYFAGIGTVLIALAVGFGGALILTAPSPSQKEQKSAYEKKVEASRDKPVATVNPEPSKPDISPDILIPVSPVIAAANAPTVSTTFSPLPSAPWPGSQAPSQETQRAPDPGMLQPVVRPAPPVEAATSQPPQPVTPAQSVTPASPAQTVATAPPAQPAAPASSAQPVANAPSAQAVAPAPPMTKSRSVETRGQRVIELREQRVVEPGGQTAPSDWKQQQKKDAFAQKKTQRKQIVVEQARPEPVDTDAAQVETRTITTYAPEPRPAPLGIFNLLLGGGN